MRGWAQKTIFDLAVALVCAVCIALSGCGSAPEETAASQATTSASAKLTVGGPTSTRLQSTSAFTATLTDGGNASVQWSVNGEVGGDTSIGVIDSTGHFTAPATMPTDSTITIQATQIGAPSLTASANVQLLNPVAEVQTVTAADHGDYMELVVSGDKFVPGAIAVVQGAISGGAMKSSKTIDLIVPATAVPSGTASIAVRNPDPGQSDSAEYLMVMPRPTRTARPTYPLPLLPATWYDYVAYAVTNLPAHYTNPNSPVGNLAGADNTPVSNPITNAGATLGRVLFYDKQLSANNTVACASCHQQANGFSDKAPLSTGFQGGLTGRKTMGLSNAKYYQRGHFFWDERANTLEDQVLMPIQNTVEMGMTLPALVTKLSALSYYPPLFQAAFGTTDVTSDRISLALAQFVRSMPSYQSKYDSAFAAGTNGNPNFAAVFTASEQHGQNLFVASGCPRCHGTGGHISANIENNGLDAVTTDVGAGNGQFKAPSLRNVALRGTYMHDGRFTSLDQVVEFYNSGVQNNPNLSPLLRGPGGQPIRLNLSAQDKTDLMNFLNTLTDNTFIADPKFASPF